MSTTYDIAPHGVAPAPDIAPHGVAPAPHDWTVHGCPKCGEQGHLTAHEYVDYENHFKIDEHGNADYYDGETGEWAGDWGYSCGQCGHQEEDPDNLETQAFKYREIITWWQEFYEQCEEESYTDTGAVWEFMERYL